MKEKKEKPKKAGRPVGTKRKEPTVAIRVPVAKLAEVQQLIKPPENDPDNLKW